MTVQELYDWAKKHKCLDVPIAKHTGMAVYDVETAMRLYEECPEIYGEYTDRVVID